MVSRLSQYVGIMLCVYSSSMQSVPPLISSSKEMYTREQIQQQDREYQQKKLTLYFSQLVSNFFSIVKNPRNVANVTVNVADIISNVVNIAINCMKRSGCKISHDEITLLENRVSLEFHAYDELIHSIIIKRTQAPLCNPSNDIRDILHNTATMVIRTAKRLGVPLHDKACDDVLKEITDTFQEYTRVYHPTLAESVQGVVE